MTSPDDEWTTAEVAAYLGVGRRTVHPTLTRWGVKPLPEPRRVGRGWTLVYRAADVIHAKANAPGRGNRRTTLAAVAHDGYQCAECGHYFPRSAIKDVGGEYYCRNTMGHNRRTDPPEETQP